MSVLSTNLKIVAKLLGGMFVISVLFIIFIGVLISFSTSDLGKGCKNVMPLHKKGALSTNKDYYPNSYFGKKEKKLYRISQTGAFDSYKCIPIKNADPATFTILSEHTAKDKNNAYIQFYNTDKKDKYLIPNIDTPTFITLDTSESYNIIYTKDKNHVYYNTQILNGADPTTFELLNERGTYTKDKNHVYKESRGNIPPSELIGADTDTFQLLNRWYAKDKHHVYTSKGKIIENADTLTFNTINEGICYSSSGIEIVCPKKYDAWDKNNKYKEGKIITQEKIDANTDSAYEAYIFNPVKKIILKNEKITRRGEWGIAYTNNSLGAIELRTGLPPKESDSNAHNIVTSLEVNVPSDADAVRFVYKFPEDNDGQRNMIEAFLGTEQIFSDRLKQLVYRYPENGWRESKWTEKIKLHKGKKITIYFRLSKVLDNNNNKEGHILIDSLIFGKIEKATSTIPHTTYKEFPSDYQGKLSPSKRNEQIKKIKETAKDNIKFAEECNQKDKLLTGTVSVSNDKKILMCPHGVPWQQLNNLCGENRSDRDWLTTYGNDEWSYTLKCAKHPECSGWDNLKCTKNGCIFSDKCFYN